MKMSNLDEQKMCCSLYLIFDDERCKRFFFPIVSNTGDILTN